MTNEIKEILFLLYNDRLTDSGKRKLEDYITNLQEENEHLKMQVECLLSKDKPKDKMIEKLALENERIKMVIVN